MNQDSYSRFANSEGMKGQDILVMLKLLCHSNEPWSYPRLAQDLGMSASEVHAAVKRCEVAGLYNRHTKLPRCKALEEFLLHGVRYVFPARLGAMTQGLPTSYGASPLSERLHVAAGERPVMPLSGGPARGPEVKPLYRSAPEAAQRDPQLHELLALIDAIRTGRARERTLAEQILVRRLERANDAPER
jgi:hypothetical protein